MTIAYQPITYLFSHLQEAISSPTQEDTASQLQGSVMSGSERRRRGITEMGPKRPSSRRRPGTQTVQPQQRPSTTESRQLQPSERMLPQTVPERRWEDSPQFFASLERFVNETTTRPVAEMINEFAQLNGLPRGEPARDFARNMSCNRYRDVICTEQNRVRLNTGRYIHANWVTNFGESRFICTQGPTPSTCDDFWTMIVQEEIGGIVMLCDIVELGRTKCHQYWPTEENPVMHFCNDQITVRFIALRHVEGNVYRTDLAVGAPQMRAGHMRVQHFHWRQWPDRGVPQNDLAPLRLLFHVQKIHRMVVHCSAGIGRTGTMVAVYLAYQTLQLGQHLNIYALIRDLRRQRAQSVQTLDQYLYIHFVILRYAQNKANNLHINMAALEECIRSLESQMRRG